MIAFLGKPSKTTPWLLQVGGHHLAFNVYYKGTAGASTPYHLAAQPTVWKDDQGKTHDPLAPMRDPLHDLLASLTPEQLKQAKLDARFNDMYVGPRRTPSSPPRARASRSPSSPTPRRTSSARRSRPGPATPPRASNTASSTRPTSTRPRSPTRAPRTWATPRATTSGSTARASGSSSPRRATTTTTPSGATG